MTGSDASSPAASRLPIHVVGGDVEALRARLPPAARDRIHRVETAEAHLFPDPDRTPGWVFIGADVDPEVVLGLLRRLGQRPGAWSPVLVAADGTTALPLSPAHEAPLDEVAARTDGPPSQVGAVSFRVAHEDLSRIRHDINNPLTAALAEVQLALMDHEPGSETAEGLQVVENQLRRIRDLAADLVAYRVNRS